MKVFITKGKKSKPSWPYLKEMVSSLHLTHPALTIIIIRSHVNVINICPIFTLPLAMFQPPPTPQGNMCLFSSLMLHSAHQLAANFVCLPLSAGQDSMQIARSVKLNRIRTERLKKQSEIVIL